MRPTQIVLFLALLTATGCGFLLWNALQGLPPNSVLLGVTLAFATVLLVLPWTLGLFRPAGAHPCHACGRPLTPEMPTGFCISCGEFVNPNVAQWYARRV